MITVPKNLHAGGSAAAIVTTAEGLCPDDEYIGFDGLRCCSRCHAHREIRVMFYGRERIFPALCKCQEERDRRAREQEQRDFQLRREHLREDGLENKAYPRRAQSTFDGHAVESAFALLLAKVTKPASRKTLECENR